MPYPYGMNNHLGGWGWGMAWGMGIWMLIGIALLFLLVIVIVRLMTYSTPTFKSSMPSDASRILDERYARGEIDDEEYQRRRRLLGKGEEPR